MSIHKVCILTSCHPSFDTRIFHKQAITLVKAGYDVTLVVQHDKDETVDGVKIAALPKPRHRLQRILGLAFQTLRFALKQKAEVYHLHDPELLPVGVLLKLLTRANIIYDIHEDYPIAFRARSWLPSFLRLFVSKIYFLAERIGIFLFNKTIVAGEDILSHLPNSSKVVLVRNYPLLDKIKHIDRKNNHRKEILVLIYAGILERERGIKEIVEAVESLNGKAKLLLLGRFFDSQFESEIRKKASNNLQLIGQVPYDEVFCFMGKADVGIVCLHPSPNNIAAASRNNKLFEYMSASLPVISSNFPSWREIVEGNNCGLTVNPMKPREIAAAVEYLLDRPELMKEMGRNGRKAVLEKYNWEQEAKKLLNLYENLLGKVVPEK